MKIADLRIQTTTPSSPSVGVVGLFANVSGVPVTVDSNGIVTQVGNSYLTASLVTPTGGIARLGTGVVFGGNSSAIATGLANPTRWLAVTVSGQNLVIPAYSYNF